MKLTEASKAQNREFHELAQSDQVKFLVKSYCEVFATDAANKGEFTQGSLNLEKSVLSANEQSAILSSADSLNFLMTRFNMLNDSQYEGHVRELALLRFEYLFLAGDTDITQDPALVANFFQKRG